MATAATAKTPSTHPTMMPVLTALCVAEELLDVCVAVDDGFVLVEGDSIKSTLCYNEIIQLITNWSRIIRIYSPVKDEEAVTRVFVR
jgi:hypothetical protein